MFKRCPFICAIISPHAAFARFLVPHKFCSQLNVLEGRFSEICTDCDLLYPCVLWQAICEALMAPEVCAADHQPCQRHLLAAVSAILTKAGHDCAACGFSLFFVLVNVLALQSRDSLYEEVCTTVNSLVSGHPRELKSVRYWSCPLTRIIPISGHQRKIGWMSAYRRVN